MAFDAVGQRPIPASQVAPVTMVRSDERLEHTQTIAVNADYITYGLKAGACN